MPPRVGFRVGVTLGAVGPVVVASLALVLAEGRPYGQLPAAAPPPQAALDSFTCAPVAVATFTLRVHVRCSLAAPGGIFFFAVSTSDSASASRFLSIFTTAKVTGKNVILFYTAADTSGTAFGCGAADCRAATGAEVQQ